LKIGEREPMLFLMGCWHVKRERWRRRLMGLGLFLFLAPFVAGLPIFGLGRFIPEPEGPFIEWTVNSWLAIPTLVGSVLLVASVFFRTD
jgi:hypothetical protein